MDSFLQYICGRVILPPLPPHDFIGHVIKVWVLADDVVDGATVALAGQIGRDGVNRH